MPGPCLVPRGVYHPIVVTILCVTLSLPDPNDNAPSSVGRDDPRVPNGTQQRVQPQKCGGSPRPEHISVDAAPSSVFPLSIWFTARLVSFRVGGSQITGVPHTGLRQHPRETHGRRVHTKQLLKVTSPSGPDFRSSRQRRDISAQSTQFRRQPR